VVSLCCVVSCPVLSVFFISLFFISIFFSTVTMVNNVYYYQITNDYRVWIVCLDFRWTLTLIAINFCGRILWGQTWARITSFPTTLQAKGYMKEGISLLWEDSELTHKFHMVQLWNQLFEPLGTWQFRGNRVGGRTSRMLCSKMNLECLYYNRPNR